MKQVNPITKAKLKSNLLQGKSLKQAALEAGYSKASAISAWRLAAVKCCIKEIEEEFRVENITVKQVLKDIEVGKKISLDTGDMTNYKCFCELLGKYLAMFTDKQQIKAEITSPSEESEYEDIKNRLHQCN
jgi:hypothetical protein